MFAPELVRSPRRGRASLVDRLVVATDVYTWKLLRLDRGLGRRPVEARVTAMISALLAAHTEE